MGRLDDKVCLISGAARGLGAATAQAMVEEGATVVLGDIRPGEGKTLADQLGAKASYAELDVTNEEAWATVVGDVVATHGRLDVLVNCAGILSIAPLVTSTLADFQKVTAVNQYGVYLGMRAALSPMLAAGTGAIVNISSIDGVSGMPGMALWIELLFDGGPGNSITDAGGYAKALEDMGFASLWLPDHVVVFEQYAPNYSYSPDGLPPYGPRQGWFDPLFGLAAMAATTSRIRLGTNILILPERNPVVLAKEVVALDHLSGGRID